MVKDLPKVLLVTDVTLSQEGGGVNRTLVNLFMDYPSKLLMLFAPQFSLKSNPPGKPFNNQVIGFSTKYLPRIRGPLGKFFQPLIEVVNLQLTIWLPVLKKKQVEVFAPDIILVCPVVFSTLLLGHKLAQQMNCPYLIYAMDNWIPEEKVQWFTGKGKDEIYSLLANAAGWIVISEQLRDSFSNHYQLIPQRVITVHNPVDLSGKEQPGFEYECSGTFKIVYAGSIWPMHYDAVAVVAEAVFELRRERHDIELVLHTDQGFWDLYRNEWQSWEVTYGSFIAYHELNEYLKQANLLLVASSFLPEHEPLTRASIQTKLTDYMASGRPILSCGPSYSVCNNFIQKWSCGLVCETNQVPKIKELLLEQMNNEIMHRKLAETAFQVLKENFEQKKVSENLYEFIKERAINAK